MWVKHGHVDVQTNMHSLHLLSLFLGISFRDPIRMLVNPLSGDAPRRALLYYFTPEDFTRQGESSVLPNSMAGLENIFVFLAAKSKNKNFLCKSIIKLPAS